MTIKEESLPLIDRSPTHQRARGTHAWLVFSALAMGLHGLIELGSIAVLVNPALAWQQFAFKELTAQPVAVAGIGIVVGTLRLLAAAGILANRMWGWILGILVSLITFSMLTLYLPAGMSDAVLSGAVLFALIAARFGGQRITA